jgi:hypothetical protein
LQYRVGFQLRGGDCEEVDIRLSMSSRRPVIILA